MEVMRAVRIGRFPPLPLHPSAVHHGPKMPRASHAAFDAAAEDLGVPQNEPAITAMIHELEVEGPYRDTALDLERRRMLAHWREQQQDLDRGEQPTDLSD